MFEVHLEFSNFELTFQLVQSVLSKMQESSGSYPCSPIAALNLPRVSSEISELSEDLESTRAPFRLISGIPWQKIIRRWELSRAMT